VAEAGRSLDELRIAEVVKQDLVVAKGKTTFRVRVNLSFKVLREEGEVIITEDDLPIISYDHF
jgi:flavin-binding protein dodecin